MGTRINRHLAETGNCSRREADRLIEAGKVFINGRRAVLGDIVEEGDEVRIGEKLASEKQKKVYLAFHKPIGVITTMDRNGTDTIMQALHKARGKLPKERIFPVGRLDVASAGLILFTNDSDLADRLLRSIGEHEKEYLVEVDKPVTDAALKAMRVGINILGRPTLPAKAERVSERVFSLTIIEGRNRQIRRMCHAVGLEVVRLKRVRILNVELGTLKKGAWRYLTPEEIAELKRIVLKK